MHSLYGPWLDPGLGDKTALKGILGSTGGI